ncbi:MAG: HAD hydrolase-like protein, partial [Oscillospiraceae bacterium]
INYPSFGATLAELRPGIEMSLDEFLKYCFDPGFYPLCRDILEFNDAEMKKEEEFWREYTRERVPTFYPGIAEIVREQKACGGLVCVVSHSCADNISRDYRVHCGALPDMIFGNELGEAQRKPNQFPLLEIMKEHNLAPHELLVVDDLKLGYDMALGCGVPFACAGWSHTVPCVTKSMKQICERYLETVEDLRELLFRDGAGERGGADS